MSCDATDPAAPSLREVFGLAWPLTLKAIMLHGIVVIDAYLVSSLGEPALAAMGLAAAIAGILLGVLMSFANATQIRIAQAFGNRDSTFLKTALFSGLAINVTACAIGLVILFVASDGVMDALAHDSWIAGQAKGYLAVFSVVIAGEAIGQILTSYFNGCGNTRLPLQSYLIAVPVNIGSSLVFIHGYFGAPAMGVVGAAVGSAIAAALQVGFLAICIYRSTGAVRAAPGWRNGSFAESLRRHLAFAAPIAATFISATLATNVCSLLYAKLGVNEFAALTLILPWIMVAGTVGMCWAQAGGIILAQLIGRRASSVTLDNFLGGVWRVAFLAAGIVSLIYLGVCLSSPWLYPELHAETRAALMSFLPVLLLLPFPKGSNAICGNTLRAGGETVYVMHVFVWSQWLFRVPVTAFLVLYLDVPVAVVFSLLLLEEIVKLPPFHLRLFKGAWKAANLAD